MYPNEPIITVVAPLIDAQLIETALLAQVNHQSLIATKTRRIVSAAEGRAVSDFGARRAHNMDAAVYGARAAYIGGAVGTATVLAGQMFDIPVSGTMAHSWVMYYKDEKSKPLTFAEAFYLATAGGGSYFGKVGTFLDGYEFDAVVAEDHIAKDVREYTPIQRTERMMYDERTMTICAKYEAGCACEL